MHATPNTPFAWRAPGWAMLLLSLAVLAVSGLALAEGEDGGGGGESAATADEPAGGDAAADARRGGDDPPVREGVVRVGRLLYAERVDEVCFASGFLATVDRAGVARVERRFYDLDLRSDDLAAYPFLVMTGNGPFELDEAQLERLRHHLRSGGFILASAACSDHAWASSFRAAIADAFADASLQPLAMSHPIFDTLHPIDRIDLRRETTQPAIYGLEVDDRLALVFSPVGLNDSSNAGGGCCCCGGNEIRNANLINANLLTWVLMQ